MTRLFLHITTLPHSLRHVAACVLTALLTLSAAGMPQLRFTHIDEVSGLTSNHLLSGYQLSDGRMLFLTETGIDLYDGAFFRHFEPNDRLHRARLDHYTGATHLYTDRHQRLWMKNPFEVRCFDFARERYVAHPDRLLQQIAGGRKVTDMFTDERGMFWMVTPQGVWSEESRRFFPLPKGDIGKLQDITCYDHTAYFFFSHGVLASYDADSARLNYTTQAYPDAMRPFYYWTTVAARTPQGVIIEIRTGTKGSICMAFDPATRQWRTLLTEPYTLHMLIVPDDQHVYISYTDGLWEIALPSLTPTHHAAMTMSEGNTLVTDINTVCVDKQGGWWLSTHRQGILYSHPWRYASAKANPRYPLPMPLLISVTHDGRAIAATPSGEPSDTAMSHRHHIALTYSQRHATLAITALNYALPRQTAYRYRIVGAANAGWTKADINGPMVGEDGVLRLMLPELSPGSYELQVVAGVHESESAPLRVGITIGCPWWLSAWAIMGYIVITLLIISGITMAVVHWRHLKRRESELLHRIEQLIAVPTAPATPSATAPAAAGKPADDAPAPATEAPKGDDEAAPTTLSAADEAFLQRAIMLVEQHLGISYTVADLSRDLCMERTGLYKKLTLLLDQSPSTFMRDIRLQRATKLMREQHLSMAEVAERVGFGSSSYMSRCFRDKYGCTPSEYLARGEEPQG